MHVSTSDNVRLMGNPAYGAGKAGLIQLTKKMAGEYREDRIRVNCIAPGFLQLFPWSETAVAPDSAPLFRTEPPEKRQGLAEDITYAAAYPASDEANRVTGQTLVLDGGDDILPRREIPPAR